MRTFPPFDAQRVETALSVVGRKWTAWVAQTLAGQDAPMRVRDIAARIPFVREPLVSRRLVQMHADGLVVRADDRRGAPYRLSALGEGLAPVHRQLDQWSRAHRPFDEPTARAARVEDALSRLQLRHTTTVVRALSDGPMRFVHLCEATGLDTPTAGQRLVRLQADGLVTRTGPRFGDPYTLTVAGAALGPIYAAVEHWHNPTTEPPPSPARIRNASLHDPDSARTAAALGRSPTAFSGLFSHAPQPHTPAPAPARPAPTRTR